MAKSLQALVGIENDPAQVVWHLRDFAQDIRAPLVGSYQVTCSDEAEWECARAFQQSFVEPLMPGLKPGSRAPLRSANLGGRFEPGAIRIAEKHFATAETQSEFKLLVVKINSHVGVRSTADGVQYGWTDRYGHRLACCGTLAALIEGKGPPAIAELHDTFRSGGTDRLAALRDDQVVPPPYRALFAAVANARLQADRAAAEAERHAPRTPTIYLIVSCVTLNRSGPDTEIVVGQHGIDWTGRSPSVRYQGLGDNPAAYRVQHRESRLYLAES